VCTRDTGSVFVCMYMSEKYTYGRKREKGIDPLISSILSTVPYTVLT